jgi:hypothetical protein
MLVLVLYVCVYSNIQTVGYGTSNLFYNKFVIYSILGFHLTLLVTDTVPPMLPCVPCSSSSLGPVSLCPGCTSALGFLCSPKQ